MLIVLMGCCLQRAAGGLAGLVLAMLLETVLLILRSNFVPEIPQKDSHRMKRRERALPTVDDALAFDSHRAAMERNQSLSVLMEGGEPETKKEL